MESEILRAALAPGPDCLAVDELGRYADGALDPKERAVADAHIRSCMNCRAELVLLQALTSLTADDRDAVLVQERARQTGVSAAEKPALRAAEIPSRGSWFALTQPRLAAAVAFVLLAVAGGFYFRTAGLPALPSSVRTGDDVTRSRTLSVRGPVGDLPASPQQLEWVAIDRASRYRVRLMEVDRRELWSASTAATRVELPEEIRALSVPSKTLLWDVTAYDAAGVAIADSGLRAFRLVPP